MANDVQNELLALLDEQDKPTKSKKKSKGPQTLIVEEPFEMKGDPLGLMESKKVNVAQMPTRIKSKSDIVIERYNPDVDRGLTTDDVEKRHLAGLVNLSDKGSTKTISSIVFSNVFTFFNMLILAIVIILLITGASHTNCINCYCSNEYNELVSFQEINAKKEKND